ncbi:hypothetical protein FisN_15Lh069 [Fistulifera solaris]|uniref:DUF4954 domain-containing protein n=1 Tax=Fistulifera solaris TaxID=1519565 RepID=A0A1Z5KAS6_FISSO|nr:hypothetical protein FisN_15Lh069 [Fistulifera solaris]|eukprot:GAX23354.1 hypothetical protein FisN_15Lh069 [Fistulifera solaris]
MTHPDFLQSGKERTTRIAACQEWLALARSSSTNQSVSEQQSMRGLFPNEIDALQQQSCSCEDWNHVRLVTSAATINESHAISLSHAIKETRFAATVILVLGDEEDDSAEISTCILKKLPPGLHSNLLISNSIIDLRAKVYRNTSICNTYIGPFATIINCGTIDWSSNDHLGLMTITVGAERGGGRPITVHPEVDMPDVVQQMKASALHTTTHPSGMIHMNIVDKHALVRDTPTLQSIYLHPHASIQGATSISNAILLPQAKIASGSTVHNVMLQWNASIVDHSSVTDTLLMEEAQAGPHSLVVSTILGPDVHVSAGEVHASIVGPNTNAHHQSLLIGCLWPLGRGNVGYGANVGSNHTGRLPDQECTAGEGVFWGLSTAIKFPVDLSSAPYTLVAAGTTLSPQRVTMPFSLIVASGEGNDILPGWLLRSSPYTLARNEAKYATRRKAQRHWDYTGWKILRAETLSLCWHARQALLSPASSGSIYSETEIPGLGANRLSEKGRLAGVEAYTNCIQMFALRGLWRFLVDSGLRRNGTNLWELELASSIMPPELVNTSNVEWPPCPWETTVDDWTIQRFFLQTEFPLDDLISENEWLENHLRTLIQLEQDYAHRVYQSKRRDDQRGVQIVPGYKQAHDRAEDDAAIADVKAYAIQVEEAILRWLNDTTDCE